jgi:hypothetical protein
VTDPETPDDGTAGERAGGTPSPPSRPPARVDPEDWASAPADDDERYQRERPPHWE